MKMPAKATDTVAMPVDVNAVFGTISAILYEWSAKERPGMRASFYSLQAYSLGV